MRQTIQTLANELIEIMEKMNIDINDPQSVTEFLNGVNLNKIILNLIVEYDNE